MEHVSWENEQRVKLADRLMNLSTFDDPDLAGHAVVRLPPRQGLRGLRRK